MFLYFYVIKYILLLFLYASVVKHFHFFFLDGIKFYLEMNVSKI